MPHQIPYLPGLSGVADRYDGYIVDIWGVIHDGMTLYPGVVDCLEHLARAGKSIVMLSNAPRRAAAVAEAMAAMGMPEDFCRDIMCSGEAAWQSLRDSGTMPGTRCFHIGPERDENLFDGLEVDRVGNVADADFIFNTGPWHDGEAVADYESILAAGAKAGLPMVCVNPDLEVIRGGRRIICAGALALRYEELGGRVQYFGKPKPEIYELCLRMLGVPQRSRILAVGDSLRTDIAGAAASGLDSALVVGGLHGEEIGLDPGGMPDPGRMAELCARAGQTPTMAVPGLVWSSAGAGETVAERQ